MNQMKKKAQTSLLPTIILLAAAIVFSGCVKRVGVDREGKSAVSGNLTELSKAEFEKMYVPPQILAAKYQKSGMGEQLYPGDELAIVIYDKLPASQETRIERKRVSEDGTVFILPIQEVTLGGMTITEAEKAIESRLKEFIVSPYVEIEVTKKAYEPQIYVFGETGRNGIFKIKEGYRLLDAVAESGGYTANAYRRSVKIIRVVDNKVAMLSVDVSSILAGNNLGNNILLQDQDILYVPKRLVTNITEVLNNVTMFVSWYVFFKSF